MLVINTPQAIKNHVASIVGRAAWDALDFKQFDPTSPTTTADCVQANYENQKSEYLEKVAMCGTAERMNGLVPSAVSARRDAQALKLWDDVKAALESIGYKW